MVVSRFDSRNECLTLAAMPSAVGLARAYVKAALTSKGRDGDTLEIAYLVTSELVTNAIEALGGNDESLTWIERWERIKPIKVCCFIYHSLTIIEVWDGSPALPKRRQAEDTDEGGRGLQLIEALGKAWGWRTPPTGGKIVWCVL